MGELIYGSSKWIKTGIKCAVCHGQILQEKTRQGQKLDNFACDPRCTYSDYIKTHLYKNTLNDKRRGKTIK